MQVSNCGFIGNTADQGGGLCHFPGSGNPTVANCVFVANTAAFTGGGIYDFASSRVINCTFAANTATDSGGGLYMVVPGVTVLNSIFWGDRPDEILNASEMASTVGFSDVQGGLPDGVVDGGGNTNLVPSFVRPPTPGADGVWGTVDDDFGDLRLRRGSPGINAGDPGFVAQPAETDLGGHARMLCGRVDIGAYEFGIGDIDCNHTVNLMDFAAWDGCMTGPPPSQTPNACAAFDFLSDGGVDLLDFHRFQVILNP